MSDNEILKNPCCFCRNSEICSDKVMVKGLNKLIKEVAPSLKLSCNKYHSNLSNTPNWMNAVELFKCNEVNC